ncbi:MAG: YqgE/AlgH family protein [Planctomycetes bacterium]|nr:YqgE/AlgH family protein [Planctomycetota bacterium]
MTSLAGKLLIARSSLRDGFFGRSVVLLLQHGPDGAFGLVLNRPAQAKELPFPVFVGGPCKMDGLLMIHGRTDWIEPDADGPPEVCPGVYVGTAEQFELATAEGESAREGFRIFTGYAGWAPKQLEAEMQDDAWIVRTGNGAVIFDTPVQELWEKLAPPTLPEPSLN